MQRSSIVAWLVPLIAVLAAINAGTGLLAAGGDGVYAFTTARGQSVDMYGQGLYRNDSLLAGAGFRGTDAVTLLVGIPFLLGAYAAALRGSSSGRIVLIGAVFYFAYNGASMTFSAAFNPLFLAYVALFSASLYAALALLVTFDLQALAARVQPGFPHRGLAIFTFVAGIGTFLIWMSEVVPALITGSPPASLGPYTTMYTHGFDSAVITPGAILIGVFVLRRKPLGYLLAAPLLILCALIGLVVIGQTVSQARAGLVFPAAAVIGMIGSWIVMGAFAIGLTLAYFRSLSPAGAGCLGQQRRGMPG